MKNIIKLFSLLFIGLTTNLFSISSPIHEAVRKNDEAEVRRLLEENPQNASIIHTEYCGLISGTEVLPLHCAAYSGNVALIKLLLAAFPDGAKVCDGHNFLPFHYAIGYGNYESVVILQNAYPAGAKIKNCYGELPLHLAAKNRKRKEVELLLATYPDGAKVADANIKGGCNGNDWCGELPLHWAVRTSDHKLVKMLLKVYPEGATIPSQRRSYLPLHVAVSRFGHYRIIKTLLKAYPEAVHVMDKKNKKPIDHVRDNLEYYSESALGSYSSFECAILEDNYADDDAKINEKALKEDRNASISADAASDSDRQNIKRRLAVKYVLKKIINLLEHQANLLNL